jgi:hypothetical protein
MNIIYSNCQSTPLICSKSNIKNEIIKDFFKDYQFSSSKFNLIIINNIYGFRAGLISLFPNCLNLSCFKNFKCLTNILNSFLNEDEIQIALNDCELFFGLILMINRYLLPFFNFGSIDFKNSLFKSLSSIFRYFNNKSIPKLFNFSSFFDSGSAIFSNKIAVYDGFVPLDKNNYTILDKLSNKGIMYSIFVEDNKMIFVFTFNLSDTQDVTEKFTEFFQIHRLYKNLVEEHFHNKENNSAISFEVYVIGDFKYYINDINKLGAFFKEFTFQNLYDTNYILFYSSTNNENMIISDLTAFNIPMKQNGSETLIAFEFEDTKKNELNDDEVKIQINPLSLPIEEKEKENNNEEDQIILKKALFFYERKLMKKYFDVLKNNNNDSDLHFTINPLSEIDLNDTYIKSLKFLSLPQFNQIENYFQEKLKISPSPSLSSKTNTSISSEEDWYMTKLDEMM